MSYDGSRENIKAIGQNEDYFDQSLIIKVLQCLGVARSLRPRRSFS